MDVSNTSDINILCEGVHVKERMEVSIEWKVYNLSLLRNPIGRPQSAISPNFTVRDAQWSLEITNFGGIDGFLVELSRHASETKTHEIRPFPFFYIQLRINDCITTSGKYDSELDDTVFYYFDLSKENINYIERFSVLCTFYLAEIPKEKYENVSNDAAIHETDSRQNNESTRAALQKMDDAESYIRFETNFHGSLHITQTCMVSIDWTFSDIRNIYVTFSKIQTFKVNGTTWILEVYNDEEKKTVCVQLSTDKSEPKCQKFSYQIAVDFLGCLLRTDKKTFPACSSEGYKALEYFVIPDNINSHIGNSCTGYQISSTISWPVYVNIPAKPLKEISVDISRHGIYSRGINTGTDILSSHMKDLFLKGEYADFVMKVKGREFQVHKAILFARSPVLYEMLHDDTAKKNNAVDIVDYEPDVFEHFLLYLYSGQVGKLSWENVMQLYALGHKYNLQHLWKECVEFMGCNLCVDTFCDAVALAAKYNLTSLIKRARKYFVKNVEQIIRTPKWIVLVEDNPIACNKLYVKRTASNSM